MNLASDDHPMPAWQAAFAWFAVLAAFSLSLVVGLKSAVSAANAVLIATIVVGLTLLILERIFPQRSDWLGHDPAFKQDLVHLVFGFGLGAFGGAALAEFAAQKIQVELWPVGWPGLVQIALGLIVAEFGMYWQHRAMHTVPGLWRIHMLHHHSTQMSFFKTTRIHAFDIGSSTFLGLFILLSLGAPAWVALCVTAFGNLIAQVQHANVRLSTPNWLNGIIGTAAVHWLHHSLDIKEGNSNFGMNVMIWDHLFGTYIPPKKDRPQLGVADDAVPAATLNQLLIPLTSLSETLARRTKQ